jgi:hypothetical protein
MKVKKTGDEDDDDNSPIFTFLAIKCALFEYEARAYMSNTFPKIVKTLGD